MSQIQERVVARLRREEDGSLSNARIEQYALLRAEDVVTPAAAWTMIMAAGDRKRAPSGTYQAKVHQSPAFKGRLEELVSEREQLQAQGPWGQLEWQTRQNYRRACAMNDVRAMTAATEMLFKIVSRNEKPVKPEKPEAEEGESERGRGAPPVEMPVQNHVSHLRERLAGS